MIDDKKKDKNERIKTHRDWPKKWELEKDTEGLDKRAIEKQDKIIDEMKNEAHEEQERREEQSEQEE